MNLVGELVLARNQILEYTVLQENPPLLAASQRLSMITSELQEGIMRTRMQPISNIWAKFPRVVRDLALGCNKQVRVEMEGKETELDKSLIEAMKDPLTHLVRNAIDHGVEMPAARRAAGKTEEGCLLMRAYHEGGQVHIEISDDGAGLNPVKLRSKALEKGLITADRAATMSEQDFRRLIFLAGFSTAEKITNISGRGVGMDVVKTNIERIGGVIDLESELGRGTTFKIRIPLTLAIVPALIITSGGERFAIPQVNLLELIRVNEEQRNTAIEYVHSNPVYRLRGKLLPIVHLNRELKLTHDHHGQRHQHRGVADRTTPFWSGGGSDQRYPGNRGQAARQGVAGYSGVRRRHHHGRWPGRAHPRCSWHRPAGAHSERQPRPQPCGATARRP
jgi:two-component system chemotaxis sensor kinase CheA